MKKRLVIFMVLAVALTIAPLAMADHCSTCKNGNCRPATGSGAASCVDLGETCSLTGSCGGPHPFTEEEPFAAEFTVASVERLDGQPTPDEQTRVASLETPAPSQR